MIWGLIVLGLVIVGWMCAGLAKAAGRERPKP